MFWKMINLFCNNYEILMTAGVIMASMIIVLIGALKPILFDKITNKTLRGAVLSWSSVLCSFAFVALAFWIKQIPFEYYWFSAIVFSGFEVVVYWLYENFTQARKGIKNLGEFLWKKVAIMFANKVNSIATDTKELSKIIAPANKTSNKKKDDLSKF